jgi:hypothetical protein
MTHDQVQRWLDDYLAAWRSYDAGEIEALFSEDAEYRYHPADDPVRGRDQIVRSWIAPDGNESGRDAPGTYDGDYRPYAVDGSRAVAVGTSTYFTDASRSTVDRVYDNCWLLDFDAAGRCRSFIEYYMRPRGG